MAWRTYVFGRLFPVLYLAPIFHELLVVEVAYPR